MQRGGEGAWDSVSYLRSAWTWVNRDRRVSTRDLPWAARALAWLAYLVALVGWIWVMPGQQDFSIFPGLPVWIISFAVGLALGFAAHDAVAGAFRRRERRTV